MGFIPQDPYMGTEKVDISSIPFTSTPPFAYDDKWDELSSTSTLWPLTPSQPVPLYSFSHGWSSPESFTHYDPEENA